MPRLPISATLVTLNEESDLPRSLNSLRWVDEIIVVDSGSTDRTQEIARSFGAKVYHNPWPGYGKQKNFAQEKASHDWILNVDADECIPEALANEIMEALQNPQDRQAGIHGYSVARKTFYLGKWIRFGGWYPNYVPRLANRRYAHWTEPSVHEILEIQGPTRNLTEPLHHYTFAGIGDQVNTNVKYAYYGSLELRKKGQRSGLTCLLRMILKPIGKFFETYILKRGCLDGIPGLIISVNAAHSMFLKYAFLFEPKSLDSSESLEPPGA